jgi:hypothetical protein
MAKPELEFHPPAGEWRPAMPGVEGMWEQILSTDPDSGDYTRLVRMEPGTDTSPAGVIEHEFREEVYLIEGDLTDLTLGQTFTAGMYCCRPPGMKHGPYRSESGCRMVEFRYAFR